ncbi:DNA ligase [Bermanella marisrubri]|uniref:DNA ligase n=1 Tax=Bermanella marisrubri TaxID=207949 RepID=Q1MZ70_9GAMM|nr:DNA ligase [Bermanella marisrubri]EAT11263.1 DNA ligase [Oceanobacter sp. RED65] [Bermanella marisrubri]
MTNAAPALILFFLLLIVPTWLLAQTAIPPLSLAKSFKAESFSGTYWLSEKLDGMRCFWDGSQLLSRSGQIIHAPEYFTMGLPDEPLDGELWIGRGQYQALMRVVLDEEPNDAQWRQVSFQVFDLPLQQDEPFESRQSILQNLIKNLDIDHVQWVQQEKVTDLAAIESRLDALTEQGAEGVMLRPAGSSYLVGRSNMLLKYKRRQDAEAKVIAYQAGQGKYDGSVGAIWVEKPDGTLFKIGTGFSDEERDNPPPIGSTITYTYQGYTERGLPRFASFERIRQDDK